MLKKSILRYKDKVVEILKGKGFDESQIYCFLRDYDEYFDKNEFNSPAENFSSVLDDLLSGIKPTTYDSKDKYRALVAMLKQRDLSVPQAMALHFYTNSEYNIAQIKRKLSTPKQLIENEKQTLIANLETCKGRDLTEEELKKVDEIIVMIKEKIRENIFSSFGFLLQYTTPLEFPFYNSFAKKCCEILKARKLIPQLDEVLKNQLPYNMILYRGVDRTYVENLFGTRDLSKAVGKNMKDNGFSSTSLVFEDSFGAYSNYLVTLRLFVPKGSQGLDVTQFSSFETESEILLNSNEVFILDYKVYDEDCIMLTGLLLSQDLECYKDIVSKTKKEIDEEND